MQVSTLDLAATGPDDEYSRAVLDTSVDILVG